jgi:hypothetical protein
LPTISHRGSVPVPFFNTLQVAQGGQAHFSAKAGIVIPTNNGRKISQTPALAVIRVPSG